MFWIIVATVCDDCGRDSHVQVLDHEPTQDEWKNSIRSGCCNVQVAKVAGLNQAPVQAVTYDGT